MVIEFINILNIFRKPTFSDRFKKIIKNVRYKIDIMPQLGDKGYDHEKNHTTCIYVVSN